MSDTDARLKVTADTSGAVAPLDDLNDKQKETGAEGEKAGQQMSAGYAAAAAAVEKFATQAAAGGKGAERSLAAATIQVQKLEQEIVDLKAQGRPTAAMEAGLEGLRGKLASSTEGLGKFRAAAADAKDATTRATQAAGEFSGSIGDVTGTLKNMSPALADAIDKYSILAAKAFALAQVASLVTAGLRKATDGADLNADGIARTESATRAYIVASDDLLKAITHLDIKGTAAGVLNLAGTWRAHAEGLYENVTAFGALTDAKNAYDLAGQLRIQKDIVEGHKAELEALDTKSAALVREIAFQKQNGGVQAYLRDEIKKTLDAYTGIKEPVDAALASQARALGIVSKAQEDASKAAKTLAEDTLQAAKKRVAAEEEAAERIEKANVALLEKLRGQYKTIYAEIEQIEQRLANSAGKGLDEKAKELQETVKKLGAEPALSQEQRAELDAAKDELSRLRTQGRTPLPGSGGDEIAAQAADIDLLQQKQFELNKINEQGQKVFDLLATKQGRAATATEKSTDANQAYRDAVAQTIAVTEAAAGSAAALGDSAVGAAVRIEELADGTKKITNTVDAAGDVFSKVGDILIEDFGEGEVRIRNTGSAAEYLSEAAGDAAASLEQAADAGAEIGKEAAKGAEKAGDGFGELKGQATELNAVLGETKGLLTAIQTKIAEISAADL